MYTSTGEKNRCNTSNDSRDHGTQASIGHRYAGKKSTQTLNPMGRVTRSLKHRSSSGPTKWTLLQQYIKNIVLSPDSPEFDDEI